jgi:hypothetical protein
VVYLWDGDIAFLEQADVTPETKGTIVTNINQYFSFPMGKRIGT